MTHIPLLILFVSLCKQLKWPPSNIHLLSVRQDLFLLTVCAHFYIIFRELCGLCGHQAGPHGYKPGSDWALMMVTVIKRLTRSQKHSHYEVERRASGVNYSAPLHG